VRDGDEVGTDPLAGFFEPGPQVLRLVAVEGAEREKRTGLLFAVRHEHDAVKVVAVRRRRPLPADERGKRAWRVVALRGLDDVTPRTSFDALRIEIGNGRVGVDGGTELVLENLRPLPGAHHLNPLAASGSVAELGITAHEPLGNRQHLRVIGDDQEIERRANLHA